ncbi:hypothetical protein DIPPA_17492 [Diplonema papillatum]|nr:hypothetical protein DIPPA_17492 [Diplonema papillatum]
MYGDTSPGGASSVVSADAFSCEESEDGATSAGAKTQRDDSPDSFSFMTNGEQSIVAAPPACRDGADAQIPAKPSTKRMTRQRSLPVDEAEGALSWGVQPGSDRRTDPPSLVLSDCTDPQSAQSAAGNETCADEDLTFSRDSTGGEAARSRNVDSPSPQHLLRRLDDYCDDEGSPQVSSPASQEATVFPAGPHAAGCPGEAAAALTTPKAKGRGIDASVAELSPVVVAEGAGALARLTRELGDVCDDRFLLETKLAAAERVRRDSAAALEQASRDKSRLERLLAAAEAAHASSKSEAAAALEQAAARYKSLLAAAEAAHASSKSEAAAAAAAHASSLRARVCALEESCQRGAHEREQEAAALQQTQAALQAERAALRRSAADCEGLRVDLDGATAELESVRTKWRDESDAGESRALLLDSVRSDLKASRAEAEAAKKQLAKETELGEGRRLLIDKLKFEAQRAVEDKQDFALTCKAEYESRESAASALIENLKSEVQRATEDRQDIARKCKEEYESRESAMSALIDNLKADVQRAVEDKRDVARKYKDECESSEGAALVLEKLRSELSSLSSKNRRLEAQLAEEGAQNAALLACKEEAEQALDRLEQDRDNLLRDLRTQQHANDALRASEAAREDARTSPCGESLRYSDAESRGPPTRRGSNQHHTPNDAGREPLLFGERRPSPAEPALRDPRQDPAAKKKTRRDATADTQPPGWARDDHPLKNTRVVGPPAGEADEEHPRSVARLREELDAAHADCAALEANLLQAHAALEDMSRDLEAAQGDSTTMFLRQELCEASGDRQALRHALESTQSELDAAKRRLAGGGNPAKTTTPTQTDDRCKLTASRGTSMHHAQHTQPSQRAGFGGAAAQSASCQTVYSWNRDVLTTLDHTASVQNWTAPPLSHPPAAAGSAEAAAQTEADPALARAQLQAARLKEELDHTARTLARHRRCAGAAHAETQTDDAGGDEAELTALTVSPTSPATYQTPPPEATAAGRSGSCRLRASDVTPHPQPFSDQKDDPRSHFVRLGKSAAQGGTAAGGSGPPLEGEGLGTNARVLGKRKTPHADGAQPESWCFAATPERCADAACQAGDPGADAGEAREEKLARAERKNERLADELRGCAREVEDLRRGTAESAQWLARLVERMPREAARGVKSTTRKLLAGGSCDVPGRVRDEISDAVARCCEEHVVLHAFAAEAAKFATELPSATPPADSEVLAAVFPAGMPLPPTVAQARFDHLWRGFALPGDPPPPDWRALRCGRTALGDVAAAVRALKKQLLGHAGIPPLLETCLAHLEPLLPAVDPASPDPPGPRPPPTIEEPSCDRSLTPIHVEAKDPRSRSGTPPSGLRFARTSSVGPAKKGGAKFERSASTAAKGKRAPPAASSTEPADAAGKKKNLETFPDSEKPAPLTTSDAAGKQPRSRAFARANSLSSTGKRAGSTPAPGGRASSSSPKQPQLAKSSVGRNFWRTASVSPRAGSTPSAGGKSSKPAQQQAGVHIRRFERTPTSRGMPSPAPSCTTWQKPAPQSARPFAAERTALQQLATNALNFDADKPRRGAGAEQAAAAKQPKAHRGGGRAPPPVVVYNDASDEFSFDEQLDGTGTPTSHRSSAKHRAGFASPQPRRLSYTRGSFAKN